MKKILIVMSIVISIFVLSGCESSGEELDLDAKILEMKTLLFTASYVMEKQGYAQKFDYTSNELEKRFGLDLFIYELYIGYVNTNEREVFLVAFQTTDEAIKYEKNLLAEENMDSRLVYREAQVVIITESQETIDIFR